MAFKRSAVRSRLAPPPLFFIADFPFFCFPPPLLVLSGRARPVFLETRGLRRFFVELAFFYEAAGVFFNQQAEKEQ